jgi:hypothetical protein
MRTINIIDESFLIMMEDLLLKKLVESAIKNTLINVANLRGLGKTTALIKFAKCYGLNAIVRFPQYSELRKKHEYSKIYGYKNNGNNGENDILKGLGRSVIDEGVDELVIRKLPIEIVTGFVAF